MLINLFLAFLCCFFPGVFCGQDFQRAFPIGEQIPYFPVDYYKSFYDIRKLSKGIQVETFDELIVQEMINKSKNCGVKSSLIEGQYVYTPAQCTNSCMVAGLDTDTQVCSEWYPNGICCSVDKIRLYADNFLTAKFSERELPQQYHGSRFKVDWNSVTVTSLIHPYTDFHNEKEFIEELRKEKVCGMKRTLENDFTIFFCLAKDRCTAPTEGYETDPYIAKPSWDDFCSQSLDIGAQVLTNDFRCCHTNFFPDSHFQRKYTNLRFQKIPVSLNYATGLRSNFMCEAYSWRYLCGKKSHKDECNPPRGYTLSRPPGMQDGIFVKDAPYIARLGVAAPHILIFHCLGAIISHRYILSVWECRQKHGIPTNVVIIGEDDTDDLYHEDITEHYEHVYTIYKILQHQPNRYDDVGFEPTLYRTGKDMVFSPRTRPACLYYRPMERPTEAYLPYFGKLRNDHWEGRFLRRQLVNIRSFSAATSLCGDRQFYGQDNLNLRYKDKGFDELNEFCVGLGLEEIRPCKYDRGTPLVVKVTQPYCSWQILGVLTTERWNSVQDVPMVFANITRWLGKLEDIVWPQPFLEMDFPTRSCPFPSNYTLPSPEEEFWKEFWVH